MTDEEMAEEYADRTRIVDENTRVGTDCISLVQDYEGNYIDIHERIKQAFLAGLKAGRPQWHYVKDGEYPKDESKVLCILGDFENDNLEVGYYSQVKGDSKRWRFENYDLPDDSKNDWGVSAWKKIVLPELPKEIE